jgi:hypothetical protein
MGRRPATGRGRKAAAAREAAAAAIYPDRELTKMPPFKDEHILVCLTALPNDIHTGDLR